MTLATGQPAISLRARVRRHVTWLTAAMLALVFVTSALLVLVAESGLRSQRERTLTRQSALITESLASALYSAQTEDQAIHAPDAFLLPNPTEFGELLKQYRSLTSITAVSDNLAVLTHVAQSTSNAADLISALKTLPASEFPPGGDDVSVVVKGRTLVTAGRITDGPGRGGPLLILEFGTEAEIEKRHVMLVVMAVTALTALLLWAGLDQMLAKLVVRPAMDLFQLRTSLDSGDWSKHVRVSGTAEIQALQESTNRMVDRANRLWQVIEWRARHLEQFDPSKRIESQQMADEASRGLRFNQSVAASEPADALPSFVCVGVAMMTECIALSAVVGNVGIADAAADSFPIPLVLMLLGSTGLAYLLGHWAAPKACARTGFNTIALVLSATMALAYGLGAMLSDQLTALMSTRALAAFSAGAMVSAWSCTASSVLRSSLDGRFVSASHLRINVTLLFLGLIAVSITASLSTESILMGLTFTACVATVGHAVTQFGSARNAAQLRHLARTHTRFGSSLRGARHSALSLLLIVIALISVVSPAFQALDESNRYAGLCLVALSIVTGLVVAYSFRTRGLVVTLAAAAVIVAPAMSLPYLGYPDDPLLRSVVTAAALALIAACALTLTALDQAETPAGGGHPLGQAMPQIGLGLIGTALLSASGLDVYASSSAWMVAAAVCALMLRNSLAARSTTGQ